MTWSVRREVNKELKHLATKGKNKQLLRRKVRTQTKNTKLDVGSKGNSKFIQCEYKSGVSRRSFGKQDNDIS